VLPEEFTHEALYCLSICSALLIAGCNRKATPKEEGESQAESANKSNLVEMSISAQQHIGMVIAPATVTKLNEFLRVTGTVQPIDSKFGVVGPLARGSQKYEPRLGIE
jgi:cobalt-zinc-cadmium efflux system membrane fusion protein